MRRTAALVSILGVLLTVSGCGLFCAYSDCMSLEVIAALEQAKDERAIRELAQDERSFVREAAIRALPANQEAARIAEQRLLDPSERIYVRMSAAKALARIGEPDSARPLERVALDPASDPSLVLECLAALCKLEPGRAPALGVLPESSDLLVQAMARKILAVGCSR